MENNNRNELEEEEEEKENDKEDMFYQSEGKAENLFEKVEMDNTNPMIQAPEEIDPFSVITPYTIDLIKMAKDCFQYYFDKVRKNKIIRTIDIYEIQNLLDVIGIKKNIHEINNKIIQLKSDRPKDFPVDNKFTESNYISIAESFKDYRIEDKLLVQAFREIDKESDGTININKLRRINKERNLGFTEEEMVEMLEFFEIDLKMKKKYLKNLADEDKQNDQDGEKLFDYETFCKLYYQG
jgi:Ca2+-binding EF-hand superfamily protein